MANTPSDIQAWRDRLQQARLSGTRRVRDTDGSEIEYRSDTEMARALAYAESLLATASPQINTIRFTTSKGL